MKKIYFSLITIAILLFTACTNDVPVNEETNETGTLKATISFEAKAGSDLKATRAASSTAIPTVSWANVKQVQLFLYDDDGIVKFSRTVKPTATVTTFNWENVPVGTYHLALLANVKSNTDAIATSVDGSMTELTDENVIGKALNSVIKIDLKAEALPSATGPHHWDLPVTTYRVGYAAPSEIFTAYKDDVMITAGGNTTVTDLTLRREISLLRARFNIEEIPDQAAGIAKPTFGNASDFIVVQRLPVGFGLKAGSFAGGILDVASDDKRVLVGATGTTTYQTADPTVGYNPTTILGGDFTLWQDIYVLPNASSQEISAGSLSSTSDAPAGRQYFIIIAASVNTGYEYQDGSTATTDGQPVYWFGTIKGLFTKNVIREVNMTLNTKGYPDIPGGPGEFGGLEITVGAPEDWNSTIVNTDIAI